MHLRIATAVQDPIDGADRRSKATAKDKVETSSYTIPIIDTVANVADGSCQTCADMNGIVSSCSHTRPSGPE